MGAWIEISIPAPAKRFTSGRTPRWVRGLKLSLIHTDLTDEARRTPRWVRGLKYVFVCLKGVIKWSHPTMGAWIEI